MSLSGLLSGGYTEGDFEIADSLSVADPLPGLLSDPLLDRRFLLRATPVNDAGATVAVDITTGSVTDRGYRTLPSDAEQTQFLPGLISPYNSSLNLPTPYYMGMVVDGASGGAIAISNGDRLYDEIAQRSWLGEQVDTYLGPGEPGTSLTKFTRIAHATSAGLQWDLDQIVVLQRDRGLLLQRELNERKFWGFGACLRFDGTGDYVDYGDILDQGSAGSFTIEILSRSTATGAAKVLASKGNTGAAGWFLYFNGSDNLFAQIQDAGATHAAIISGAGSTYLDGSLRRFSFVVDRSAQQISLYINGVQFGSNVSCSTVASIDNTAAIRVGSFGDGSSGMAGDQDDFRFWTHARIQNDIKADMHKELLGTESNLAIYTKYNEGSGSTANDETANNRDGTITNATWVGSLEGDTSIASKPKPRCYGVKRQIEPVLVDPQRLVYQINDGSIQGVTAVRDSGDPITFGSDLSDIYSAAPAAGTYNTCLAKGLIRLGSSPVGTVTCDPQGDNGGSLGYVTSAANISRKMAGLVLSDPSDFDVTSFAALNTINSAVCGYYSGTDSITIGASINAMLISIAAWGALNRVGQFVVGIISDPWTQTATFDLSDGLREPTAGGVFRREPANLPVKEVIIGYRRYNRQMDDSEVAGAVSLTNRYDFGQEYRYVNVSSLVAPADGDVLTLLTELDTYADAKILADSLLALWEIERDLYFVSPKIGVLSHFIGSIGILAAGCYDLAGGKNGAIVGFVENFGDHSTVDDVVLTLLMAKLSVWMTEEGGFWLTEEGGFWLTE